MALLCASHLLWISYSGGENLNKIELQAICARMEKKAGHGGR